MTCQEMERLLLFYACDELEAGERRRVEEHADACAACADALERERKWVEAFAAQAVRPEEMAASGALLTRCRAELAEALDEQAERWQPGRRLADIFRPARWIVPHPGWSAAALVLAGVLAGQMIPHFIARRPAMTSQAPAMTVTGNSLNDRDLRNVAVSGVNWLPASTASTGSGAALAGPEVELTLSAEKPMVMRGTLDDSDVKRVLLYVVENSDERFNSGVRLDSMEVLRTRSNDEEVRRVLCNAARRDRNPGVRLKAMEALRNSGQDDRVRQALLDALLYEDNPGVRIEAIGALRVMAENSEALPKLRQDTRAVRVLQDLMRNDRNKFVRMQSAAAVRQIGPRETF